MPAQLIINADDFGLTRGINRAIEQLHRAGVLSSATLMANSPAFDDAVAIAHRNPSLGVGCHVVLVDGLPVAPPESLPSLLGPDHRSFRPSLPSFAFAALLGQLKPGEILAEALAQIRKLQGAGIHVTHIDTHKHVHLCPGMTAPLLEAAHQASVRAIRNPFEPAWSLALGHGPRLRRLEVRLLAQLQPHFARHPLLRSRSIATTGGTFGIAATGSLNANTVRDLLAALPDSGAWELVCHPGYSDPDLDRVNTRLRTHRDTERSALLAVIPSALSQPGAPSLIHYGGLHPARAQEPPT